MGLKFAYLPGQTPLEEEEKDGLRIPTITTREELDEFEQQNIEHAVQWSLHRRWKSQKIITEGFIKTLHKRMYGEVWSWAGKFRRTNKNLGADWPQIGTQLKCLLDDIHYWINHETYPADEIAIRFKHRLVSIHCFPNGNGRHSRLMADIIIEKIFDLPVFTWGAGNPRPVADTRALYIQAVKAADQGNMIPLLTFSRS